MKILKFYIRFFKRADVREYLASWVDFTKGAVAYSEKRGHFRVYGPAEDLFSIYSVLCTCAKNSIQIIELSKFQ